MSSRGVDDKDQLRLLQQGLEGKIVVTVDLLNPPSMPATLVITTLDGHRVTIETSEWISEVLLEETDGKGGWK